MSQTGVDPSIGAKVAEIKAQPYAKFVTSEEVIQRNFGFKIIRQQVSRGVNSMIYRCEAPKFDELYCVVKAYQLGKDKVRSSFKEETCQIMRYVSNKCAQLAAIYDIFYTNDKIYIFCDWSAKGDVISAIKNRVVRLNETMLKIWAHDILSAVQFLHSNGIAHRNVAPACLLLTNEHRVKLTCLSDATIYCKPDGTVIKHKWAKFSRTRNWNQAPEVALNKEYDTRRADVWSVGATIYWFIKRVHPIDYGSKSKMTRQLHEKLSIIKGKVSTKCQTWLKKMLAFQPSERPSIAQAIDSPWLGGTGASTSARQEAKEPTLMPEKGEATATGEASGPEDAPVEAPPAATAAAPEGSDAADSAPAEGAE